MSRYVTNAIDAAFVGGKTRGDFAEFQKKPKMFRFGPEVQSESARNEIGRQVQRLSHRLTGGR
jgi:hypothetical protein